MALIDDYALSSDPPFQQRLAAAMSKVATVVAGEATSTTNHVNRQKFAQLVIADGFNQARRYCLALIENFAWTTNTTDATLTSNVTSAWDALSNNLAGV